MFEENGALQRASTTKPGGLFNSRDQNHLRRIARMAAFICGWEFVSSVLGLVSLSHVHVAAVELLAGITGGLGLAFAGLGVLIFLRQARWAYVVMLVFLVLQVIGSMIQAPISLGMVISAVLTALTAVSMRAAFQLATVRRDTISPAAAEKVFS